MKKSQAAMEFLLTYGWAILAVVLSISALAYFGVLNPEDWFQRNICTLPAGLSCLDHNLLYVEPAGFGDPQNDLNLIIKNNLGVKIKIERIEINEIGFYKNYAGTFIENNKEPNHLAIYDITKYMEPEKLMEQNEKYDLEIKIYTKNTQSDLPHIFKGTIKGKVN